MNQPELSDYLPEDLKLDPQNPPPIDNLSDIQEALERADISYWTSNEDNPICLTITTEHTHQMAFGIRAPLVIAQHWYNKALLDYFNEYPVIENAKTLIWSHPRPHRFSMLVKALPIVQCTAEEKADLIVSVYVDTEIFDREFTLEWCKLIQSHHELLRATMLPVKKLVDDAPLTIYHGVEYDCDDDEFYPATAWTLDKAIAEKFARRFSEDSPRPVISISSTTRDIYSHASFYTNARSEQELYIPDVGDMDIILTQ